jgi:flagellar biosynthesis protein FlhB
MAEKPASERTEQPTARRLSKTRKEGQVPQSQELPAVLILLTLIGSLWLLGPGLYKYFEQELVSGISGNHNVFLTTDSFVKFANTKITNLMGMTFPILLGLSMAGVVGSVAVSGINFAPKALKFKPDAINPVKGFANLFSSRSLVTLVISIAKLIFVGVIVYYYLIGKLPDVMSLRWASAQQIFVQMCSLIFGIFIRVGIAIVILAITEVYYQKWKYLSDLKMTKQEVRREHKEDEGSPEVKRRIRMLQIQMASKRMLQEVPKANVILVNPTHVAVALKYDAKGMSAPVLLAKGADHLCETIKDIARAHGVPIIHRPELARSIYASVEPGQAIPETLYVAVAEVLAMIYRLRHRK